MDADGSVDAVGQKGGTVVDVRYFESGAPVSSVLGLHGVLIETQLLIDICCRLFVDLAKGNDPCVKRREELWKAGATPW
jgi:hypothetical protein